MKLILPILYNTYEKPIKPNEYSIWIPKDEGNYCEMYRNNRWMIIPVKIDEDDEDRKNDKRISDKEYNLIKAIREYMEE